MLKLLYYLPALLTLAVIIVVDESWLKVLLLIVLSATVIVSKYKRRQLSSNEIEYDERVNTNIQKYSFGFMVIMNALLICYFILVSKFGMNEWLTNDLLLVYLSTTLIIPIYIIPSIAKKF
ncbi:hypothetical protein F9U64_11970 [Gracilibacillus oryzae]|uniref:Uncharacterized protein n=1 Tax=Gracilibacillus oryzae TaxID=1672701 RepID=A0A7C8GSL7_9BACI|nr:hypothetical protein [Gracilibacillus oryzae]KAB8133617.1 hypothetical protein F9U64_11970 [Gracilibacillus oryzae]